jgi:PPK2 family polyphosphate:nucleotide phosphotransferase
MAAVPAARELGGVDLLASGVMKTAELLTELRVAPGRPAGLATRNPDDRLDFGDKEEGSTRLTELVAELSVFQTRLWAEARRSLLLVLQGLDASGKDGTIRRVFTGMNPQGCRVHSFKAPAGAELAHDYLWRVHAVCPEHGEIGIFNRSHYEDVVTTRVRELAPQHVWKRRPAHIREFERMLADEGTTLVKVFLNVSRDEQRRRLEERLENPEKAWKFRREDLDDRANFDDYIAAYEEVLTETSTEWAPWFVVPADRNWVRNLAVAELLVNALRTIDPQLPPPDPQLSGLQIT